MDDLVLILTKTNGKKIMIPFSNILFIEESVNVGQTAITLKEEKSSLYVFESISKIEGFLRSIPLRRNNK